MFCEFSLHEGNSHIQIFLFLIFAFDYFESLTVHGVQGISLKFLVFVLPQDLLQTVPHYLQLLLLRRH
jgi:hypothetical protein